MRKILMAVLLLSACLDPQEPEVEVDSRVENIKRLFGKGKGKDKDKEVSAEERMDAADKLGCEVESTDKGGEDGDEYGMTYSCTGLFEKKVTVTRVWIPIPHSCYLSDPFDDDGVQCITLVCPERKRKKKEFDVCSGRDGRDGKDGEGCEATDSYEENGVSCFDVVCSDSKNTLCNGADGDDGERGDDGKDGDDGDDGKDGVNGADGARGAGCLVSEKKEVDGRICQVLKCDGVNVLVCDGKDGEDGEDGISPEIQVVYADDLDECASGSGNIITIGIDGNEDGDLDDDEDAVKSYFICDGRDGQNGRKGDKGHDGKDGRDGKDGDDGVRTDNDGEAPTIVYRSYKAKKSDCRHGGWVMLVGQDKDGDMKLDLEEVDEKIVACRGHR